MELSSERTADGEMERILENYGTPLLRLGVMMLGQQMDAEDALSETLLRYLQKAPAFRDQAQERAWLYTVEANVCRDMLRRCKHLVSLEADLAEYAQEPEDKSILEALERLPEKYRTVLYLTYIEGYRSHEAANILHTSAASVRKRLQKARKLLKLEYEQE